MEAIVKKAFVDSKNDNKLYRVNSTWTGTKSRFEEINEKQKGSLEEGKATETKERKLNLETKEATKETTAKTSTSAKATATAKEQQANK